MSTVEPAYIGRYEIDSLLGQGGMGMVYKARDPEMDRWVAIKTVKFQNDQQRARFQQEIKAAGKLNYPPHIITIYHTWVEDEVGYIVMEFVGGGTLVDWLASPVPWREAVSLLLPICQALAYAHRQGIIHRDVKPANILISTDNVVKLTDFGVARLDTTTHGRITTANSTIGTPFYTAPEQVRNEPVDGRADIFSLGVVLFELITDRHPFSGGNLYQVLNRIAQPEPADLTPLKAVAPQELVDVVGRALEKNPAHRFSTADEMASALVACLGQPLASPSPQPLIPATPISSPLIPPSEKKETGLTLIEQAQSYLRSGDWQEAEECFLAAIGIFQEQGEMEHMAPSLGNLGLVYYSHGETKPAINYIEQALQVYRRLGNVIGEGSALATLGSLYWTVGSVDRAISCFHEALRLSRKMGDSRGEATALAELGRLYQVTGRTGEAKEQLNRAVEIAQSGRHHDIEATALNNLGTVYLELGNFEDSIREYSHALALYQKIGDLSGEANLQRNLGVVALKIGDLAMALEFAEKALNSYKQLGNKTEEGAVLQNLGDLHQLAGKYNDAISYHREALSTAEAVNDSRGKLYALVGIARALLDIGQLKDALPVLHQALTISQDLDDVEYQHLLLSSIGDTYSELNEPTRAYEVYHFAIELIETNRDPILLRKRRETGEDKQWHVYQRLISLLVRMEQISEALSWAERAKSRQLFYILKDESRLGQNLPQSLRNEVRPLEVGLARKVSELQEIQARLSSEPLENPSLAAQAAYLRKEYNALLNERVAKTDPEYAAIRLETYSSHQEIAKCLTV